MGGRPGFRIFRFGNVARWGLGMGSVKNVALSCIVVDLVGHNAILKFAVIDET